MKSLLTIALAFALLHSVVAAPEPTPKEEPVPPEQKGSVVRVNSTNQSYDFLRPWSKEAPFSRRGLGVLIDGHKILVTAELVENSDYIELERADSGEKSVATVQVIDYEANLATLSSPDPKFLEGMQPAADHHRREDRRLPVRPAVGDQWNPGFNQSPGYERRGRQVRT